MKKVSKLVALVAFLLGWTLPTWGQAPSTEGRDFWVTYLRACSDKKQKGPTELKLTFSAQEACEVTIENTNASYSKKINVPGNSSTEFVIPKGNWGACYNDETEEEKQDNYTALHVTATKDISLFAGNYRDKSFDAANVLPTAALLDDYLVQTYPPSDHENSPQGSHFAIVAVEDGETTVDYNLTAKTTSGKIGSQTVTLKKGQVWYVWTGKNAGDEADLSGTTIKARNGKKVAVFQGCSHTNVPDRVRDRDHLFSQAMPTAYWGTEFGITASRMHRRDIIAVMALNDGTEVYINSEDGEPVLVHTFNFAQDKKQYWTFEIGEYLAYCADDEAPSYGKLPAPLVVDSSCYLTTSCPAGVHLFMVSNRYDNAVSKVSGDTLVDDPAMLWISPIEQVIKEINFATYQTTQAKFHFMNIVTATGNVPTMQWNGQSIASHFHPLRGTDNDYSFARIEIPNGNHNLKGDQGFLAHVYGYGERESYAYSCGSSTIQRSISFNDTPLEIDSISTTTFCEGEDIEMKLNIGNNDYQSVHWDYGDGVSYDSDPNAPNSEKKISHHTYTSPGWYDLKVTAVYRNPCTGTQHTDPLGLRFYVSRPDTIRHTASECVAEDYQGEMIILDTTTFKCDSVVITQKFLHRETSELHDTIAQDVCVINGVEYTTSQEVSWTTKNEFGCKHTITYNLTIVKCLDLQIANKPENQTVCAGENLELPFSYSRDGAHNKAYLCKVIIDPSSPVGYRLVDKTEVTIQETGEEEGRSTGLLALPISRWKPGKYIGCILMEDANCGGEEQSTALDITVNYPEDLLVFKFNNVLLVLQNKGYTFESYQWYHNGEKIDAIANPSAASSVFHTEEIFKPGDSYYVVLQEKGKEPLPTCPFTVPNDLDNYGKENTTIDLGPQDDSDTSSGPADKKIINNRICIEYDGRIYDMYGQRVQ